MCDLEAFFTLYCINAQCQNSIFKSTRKYFIPFNTDSLLSYYRCPTCDEALLSVMDIELEEIAAESKVKLTDKEPALKMLMWLN